MIPMLFNVAVSKDAFKTGTAISGKVPSAKSRQVDRMILPFVLVRIKPHVDGCAIDLKAALLKAFKPSHAQALSSFARCQKLLQISGGGFSDFLVQKRCPAQQQAGRTQGLP